MDNVLFVLGGEVDELLSEVRARLLRLANGDEILLQELIENIQVGLSKESDPKTWPEALI